MKSVSNRGNFFKSEKKWDLENFCEIEMILRLTDFGIVLEYFCRIEVRLRIILSKKAKGRKGVGLKIICPSEKGEVE